MTFFLQNNYNPCAAEKEINLGNVFKTYTHRYNHIGDFKESLLTKLLLIEYGEPQILLQNFNFIEHKQLVKLYKNLSAGSISEEWPLIKFLEPFFTKRFKSISESYPGRFFC